MNEKKNFDKLAKKTQAIKEYLVRKRENSKVEIVDIRKSKKIANIVSSKNFMEILVKVRWDEPDFETEYSELSKIVEEGKNSNYRICINYVQDSLDVVLFKTV